MAKSQTSRGINDDDIKKTKEYTDALDKLQTSLTGINSVLPKFADGLEIGLQAVAEKLPDVIASMTKLNLQNKELAATGQKPISVFAQLASSLFSWNGLVSVGITLLTTYGSTIIKWAADMIKGQTTLSAFGKVMKDNAILTNALIQTKLQASKAAQSEITDLSTLYRATQNHNQSLAEKKDVITALKQQWPDTFGQLSDEAIATGRAADAYKALKEQILAAAIAEAAKNKITANYGRILENNEKINKERSNNVQIVNEQKTADKALRTYTNMPVTDDGSGAIFYSILSKQMKERRAASDKIIYDAFTDTERLNTQIERFYQEIDKSVQQYGPGIIGHKIQPDTQNTSAKTKRTANKSNPQSNNKRDAAQDLQAVSIDFSKKIELDKQNYDTEQAALDEQFAKKLISQQQYQEQSQQLQEKYHQNIGAKIKDFSEIDFDSAKKNLQDVVQQKQEEQAKITEITKQHAQERKDFEVQTAQQVSNAAFSILQNSIKSQSDAKIKQLETQKNAELSNTNLTSAQKQAIDDKYKKQEAAEKVKAFKAEQRASMLQAVINGALAVTKVTAQTGIFAAFTIPAIIAETAIQVATIAAQKTPQYAKGGLHYQSDGRGALLSGYSRTDNTNAYLRSGEAVVVSEAMRNPWARNLVSAINVAHGGRDFSVTNPGRGYAIGGIFTDGGNSNRYYNQPMNDQKDLANTIAYQMINNFPPVYVDVKDINSQQNILAQTVNRVNL